MNKKVYAGYEYLNNKILSLKKGEKVYCLDFTTDFCWLDFREEKEFVNNSIKAAENGAIINRIIIVGDRKKPIVFNNDLIKYNIYGIKKPSITAILDEQEVKEKYLKEFKSFKQGFLILEHKNGLKELFMDSFVDNNNICYVVDDNKIIDQLQENYNILLNAIKENKLKRYNVSN